MPDRPQTPSSASAPSSGAPGGPAGAAGPARGRKKLTRKNQARRSAAAWRDRNAPQYEALRFHEVHRKIPVGLSTSSVFPLGLEDCFRAAADTGYDGVEVMASFAEESRSPERLRTLVRVYELPILSLHAPTLFFLQFVWGRDPRAKLEKTVQMAVDLEIPTVVAHPPFRWQGDYARRFVDIVRELEDRYQVEVAVENMYPWRLGVREVLPYLPDHDPTDEDFRHVTIDLSHASTAGDDALAMIDRVGDRLAHLHLADGSGHSLKDEHLVPGDGKQPVKEILSTLVRRDWYGSIVVEISTGSTRSLQAKLPAIQRSIDFARRELGHHLRM